MSSCGFYFCAVSEITLFFCECKWRISILLYCHKLLMVKNGHSRLSFTNFAIVFNGEQCIWINRFIQHIETDTNGQHFFKVHFQIIFLNENCCTLIIISLKFVPRGPIKVAPRLVRIMAWPQRGEMPQSEPMLAFFTDAYMRHLAYHMQTRKKQWVRCALIYFSHSSIHCCIWERKLIDLMYKSPWNYVHSNTC